MGSHSGYPAEMSKVGEGRISDPTVEIKIKTLDSTTYTLRVEKCVPVPTLKEQVAEVTGILSERQRLICRGRVLKDDQLLSAYHVEDGHTLHLVVREPIHPSQNMNDHTGPNYPPVAPDFLGAPGGPRVFVRSFNMADQMQGGPPDIDRIFSALMTSLGSPLTRSGNVTDGQAIPDSLTTLFQYLNQVTAEFALANGAEEPGSPPYDSDYVDRPEPSRVSFRRGLPRAESLAEVLRSTVQLLINQTVETLNRLAFELQFQSNVTDASARVAIQSNAMRSGIIFRNLGALFLELGRTTMMLRMGLTPADAVVTAGPAVFVNRLGPNPIMVQPFPMGSSHPSAGFGPSPMPRNAGIRIGTGVFSGATNHGERTGQQLFPGHVTQAQSTTGISTTASSGLPEVNLRPIRLFGIVPESRSPGLDSSVMASPPPTSANAADFGASAIGGLGGGQTGTGNGRPVSRALIWDEMNHILDEYLDIPDDEPPALQTAATNTTMLPGFSFSAGASASTPRIPPSPSENGFFFSNALRQLMPYISQNSTSRSAAGPSSTARDVNEDVQTDEPSSSDSKRLRRE